MVSCSVERSSCDFGSSIHAEGAGVTVLYGYADAGEQAWMVLDRPRTEAFRCAIAETVRPGDIVLDVGSGSGLLALFAAKAGAEKVYAVERTAAAELAAVHARENQLSGVIEVVRADLMSLKPGDLDPRPTVIVAEMLGHFAPDENLHRLTRHAVRLCAAHPRLIPGSYEVFFAPIYARGLEDELASLHEVGGVSLQSLAERLRHRPFVGSVDEEEVVGPLVSAGRTLVDSETPQRYDVSLRMDRTTEVNGICAWFVAHLAEGISLKAMPGEEATHWKPMVLPLSSPLPCREGDTLEFTMRPRYVGNRGSYAWTVRANGKVRHGDAMRSLVGTKEDTLAELELEAISPRPRQPVLETTDRLEAWACLLGGVVPTSIDEMVGRLLKDSPDRYPDREAACEEAKALLWAAKVPW